MQRQLYALARQPTSGGLLVTNVVPTVVALRAELGRRGLDARGFKAELIARLEAAKQQQVPAVPPVARRLHLGGVQRRLAVDGGVLRLEAVVPAAESKFSIRTVAESTKFSTT